MELHDALAAAVTGLQRPHVYLEVGEHLEVDDDTAIALVRCVQEIVTTPSGAPMRPTSRS